MISVEQPSATFRPSALLAGTLSPRAGHLPFASDLIAAVKPSTIVELGVSYGDTYFGFCQLVSEHGINCACYGVDTWRKGSTSNGTGYEAVSRHNEAKYRGFSHLVRKPFDDALTQFADESISLLSIDGGYSHQVLRHTFDTWLPKLKAAGVILLSDISIRGTESGAWRLWDEVRTAFPHFSFRNRNGLGLLGKSAKDVDAIPFLSTLFRAPRDQQERLRRYYALCSERLDLAAKLGASGAADAGCSLFQVLRSQVGEYQSTPELSHVINPGAWINLYLDLPSGIGDNSLRLDVANRPAVVELATLCLRKADGSVLWNWNPKDATDQLRVEGTAARMPATDFFRVLSFGNAPRVFLPEFRGSTFEQPLTLEVRLRVDLELSAVQEMNRNWADLEKAKAELASRKTVDNDAVSLAALETAVSKSKTEAAKHLAQARIEHETKLKQIAVDADRRLETLRGELEQQVIQLSMQLEEERRAHQVTQVDKEQLLTQQPRMLQEISIAQGNVEELKAEVERLSMELSHAEYELTELRKLNARISAALEEERAIRATIQESSSWQLTKPFRAVGDLFGPRKRY